MQHILLDIFIIMNNQILSSSQQQLLPLVQSFRQQYYLVGGTAIALHLGHRRSIDFDLFSDDSFDPMKIRSKLTSQFTIDQTISQGDGELTILIQHVKITFFHYPFPIERNVAFDDVIQIPDLLTLGAMKAFALGRRAKWKDYVDLYCIFQTYSFKELIDKTNSIFKQEFNEKLFRTQLGYFDDIDYSEAVEFMPKHEIADDTVKQFLQSLSVQK